MFLFSSTSFRFYQISGKINCQKHCHRPLDLSEGRLYSTSVSCSSVGLLERQFKIITQPIKPRKLFGSIGSNYTCTPARVYFRNFNWIFYLFLQVERQTRPVFSARIDPIIGGRRRRRGSPAPPPGRDGTSTRVPPRADF